MKKMIVMVLSVAACAFAGTLQADTSKDAGSTAKAHLRAPAHVENMPSSHLPSDAREALETADRFSKALQDGDFRTVEAILDPDVLILESGGAERNRQQYLDHHAPADAKFLSDAHIQLSHRSARRHGDLVWIGSESEIHTRKDDKPLSLLSAETMILRQVDESWRIVHIHWSSRPKPSNS